MSENFDLVPVEEIRKRHENAQDFDAPATLYNDREDMLEHYDALLLKLEQCQEQYRIREGALMQQRDLLQSRFDAIRPYLTALTRYSDNWYVARVTVPQDTAYDHQYREDERNVR